jgi:hypothetical protein
MSRTHDNEDLASGAERGSMVEGWQRYWRIQGMRDNPPHIRQIPPTLEYLRTYVQELAYIDPCKRGEHPRKLRRRVY